ncbi:MAG: riboflavin biosynthesis protein RibF [Planctomycetales bacterium]|nr:riboflavin biosynthesis protein RibF [Planctomycetales bacterium]
MPALLTSLDDLPPELLGGALAVGNFDGVHRGHGGLIQQLVRAAEQVGGPALVMTFHPPPTALLYPERPLSAPLTTLARRAELLLGLGVTTLLAYPTDHDLLALSPHDFFQQKVVGLLRAKAMVEGPNFRFGRDRAGDVSQLAAFCSAANIQFAVAQATQDEAGLISSTRIRRLLAAGEIGPANALLTRPYALQGEVVRGAGRGRQLGFPTANLDHIESLIPGYGVYAGKTRLEGRSLAAAINIGPNPTFGEQQTKVEIHLIDYAGPPLYGQRLEVSLHDKIRDIQKFPSVDELRAQIAKDIAACSLRI